MALLPGDRAVSHRRRLGLGGPWLSLLPLPLPPPQLPRGCHLLHLPLPPHPSLPLLLLLLLLDLLLELPPLSPMPLERAWRL